MDRYVQTTPSTMQVVPEGKPPVAKSQYLFVYGPIALTVTMTDVEFGARLARIEEHISGIPDQTAELRTHREAMTDLVNTRAVNKARASEMVQTASMSYIDCILALSLYADLVQVTMAINIYTYDGALPEAKRVYTRLRVGPPLSRPERAEALTLAKYKDVVVTADLLDSELAGKLELFKAGMRAMTDFGLTRQVARAVAALDTASEAKMTINYDDESGEAATYFDYMVVLYTSDALYQTTHGVTIAPFHAPE